MAEPRSGRRALLGSALACGATALLAGASGGRARPAPTTMTVYRDSGCGCCKAWAVIARRAGYRVSLVDGVDMAAIKARHGVPPALQSCHTAVADGLVIEGHVPMAHVARLLRQRPAGVRGIAVPGMPAGSPGMEVPDGRVERFTVFAFDSRGRARPFAA